ncbi:MAG TPA: phosphotransferase family protein [Cyclobacteriaceae bacterium]|nr:phosphotransferase family protein [Cyclobacteriaceae bacterium]
MIAEDKPERVRSGEEINLHELNRYLSAHTPIETLIQQWQFPGGYSNLTYLLTTASGKEYILRRPPKGAAIKSAHDMSREYNLLTALQPHYTRIPKPVHLAEDSTILGSPFYLMERLHGVILRPSLVKNIQIAPGEMKAISEALVDNLVALHAIDIHASGLNTIGKPEGYITRQVDGWTKRYKAAQTDEIKAMEEVGKWLAANIPAEHPPTLLHNDYKFDNIVLDEQHLPTIRGVLDWEMATVGDPWMDLGASLAYWAESTDEDLAKVFNVSWLPGNLTRKQVVARYQERSGRQADPVFYYVFGLFKNAVIAQQIYARWKQGHSNDPRFGQLIHVIHNLAGRGRRALDTLSL